MHEGKFTLKNIFSAQERRELSHYFKKPEDSEAYWNLFPFCPDDEHRRAIVWGPHEVYKAVRERKRQFLKSKDNEDKKPFTPKQEVDYLAVRIVDIVTRKMPFPVTGYNVRTWGGDIAWALYNYNPDNTGTDDLKKYADKVDRKHGFLQIRKWEFYLCVDKGLQLFYEKYFPETYKTIKQMQLEMWQESLGLR